MQQTSAVRSSIASAKRSSGMRPSGSGRTWTTSAPRSSCACAICPTVGNSYSLIDDPVPLAGEVERGDERADALRDRRRHRDVVGLRVHEAARTRLERPRSRSTQNSHSAPFSSQPASHSSAAARTRFASAPCEHEFAYVVCSKIGNSARTRHAWGQVLGLTRPTRSPDAITGQGRPCGAPRAGGAPTPFPRARRDRSRARSRGRRSRATRSRSARRRAARRLRVHLLDDLEAALDEDRGEAHRRLVHQQQLRAGHQRAAHRDHLLLAAGERPRELLPALGEQREESRRRARGPRERSARGRRYAPISRFSSTVIGPKSRRFSGTIAIPRSIRRAVVLARDVLAVEHDRARARRERSRGSSSASSTSRRRSRRAGRRARPRRPRRSTSWRMCIWP